VWLRHLAAILSLDSPVAAQHGGTEIRSAVMHLVGYGSSRDWHAIPCDRLPTKRGL
jgi:hypothetical protein